MQASCRARALSLCPVQASAAKGEPANQDDGESAWPAQVANDKGIAAIPEACNCRCIETLPFVSSLENPRINRGCRRSGALTRDPGRSAEVTGWLRSCC